MFAVFTAPDAAVLAALVAAVGSSLATLRNAHRAAAQTRNNGGTTMRDAIDRIEARTAMQETLGAERHREVVARLDHGAAVMAEHADRLAVIEARPTVARSRSTDKPRKAAS